MNGNVDNEFDEA